MKSSLERKVAAAIALALVCIAGLGVLQYRTIRRVNEDSRQASHTQTVLLARLIREEGPSEEFMEFFGESETTCDKGKTSAGNGN